MATILGYDPGGDAAHGVAALHVVGKLTASPLILYALLMDIKSAAHSFESIDHFRTTLNKTHVGVSVWSTAFQKAHLLPLAVMKDKQRVPSREKSSGAKTSIPV